jgi:hypothetical protein
MSIAIQATTTSASEAATGGRLGGPATFALSAGAAALAFAATYCPGLAVAPALGGRLGAAAALAAGAMALALKSAASSARARSLRGVLLADAASFLLRLVALGAGAFACAALGWSALGFCIAFMGASLVQQAFEVRRQLAVESSRKEASP